MSSKSMKESNANTRSKKRRIANKVAAAEENEISEESGGFIVMDAEEVVLDDTVAQRTRPSRRQKKAHKSAGNDDEAKLEDSKCNDEEELPMATSKKQKVTNFEVQWLERLQDLRDYKEKNGDCLVSKSRDFRLGKWVARQRQEYKKMQQGKKSCLNEDRVNMLEAEGFVWIVREPYEQVPWNQRLSELAAYKEERGTCVVPKNTPGYEQLALWCMNQRQEYRKRKEGKKTKMTDKRVQQLDDVGFVWRMSEHENVSFEERMDQLREYKLEHGDCNVPRRYSKVPQLGEWVKKTRAAFKEYVRGFKSRLTEERVQLLDAEGFDWDLSAKDVPWETRFAELVSYKEKHGDCLVPQRYPDNPSLGVWVNCQRVENKKLSEGRKSSLTEARLLKLGELGFVWKTRPGRKSSNGHSDGTAVSNAQDKQVAATIPGLPAKEGEYSKSSADVIESCDEDNTDATAPALEEPPLPESEIALKLNNTALV
mmetsp:Transcript_6646/g.9711  ORF Transcript_6646/g.9711 Transcript_6646/m.9711 type:complete len:482 (+) Transcript_6646:276-1721(+)|eukprot:CAMPEP_0196823588 /NCGR_PEP_ID=MMETSP1362-20130617/88074_1 /TAXON_ID=163516 /ORGANISM="Leptocylindrus danicus, Strain CCMP1856" /LENGTH=481 /DNA_ID=CAMNT_0042203503 /DNA_START=253 /DNA_END=1698 /DNA_ORIENTATION=+